MVNPRESTRLGGSNNNPFVTSERERRDKQRRLVSIAIDAQIASEYTTLMCLLTVDQLYENDVGCPKDHPVHKEMVERQAGGRAMFNARMRRYRMTLHCLQCQLHHTLAHDVRQKCDMEDVLSLAIMTIQRLSNGANQDEFKAKCIKE